MAKDYELDRLHNEIKSAQRAVDSAKSRLESVNSRRSGIKSQIESCNYRIADLKHSVDLEYDAVRTCKAARDRIGADNHRYRAESFKDALRREYDIKNGYYTELNSYKSEYESALNDLRNAKAKKQQAIEAFQSRLQIVKAQNEQKRAQWKETFCKKCGKKISYHIDWKRVPDMCKECIAVEKAKWHETPCIKCGRMIRYNEDWAHIPHVCKDCKLSNKR